MINIINVGLGNVQSVSNWARTRTEHVRLIHEPSEYFSGSLIIPGVASSSELMKKIKEKKFDSLIKTVIQNEVVLGICAGYQILCDITTEEYTMPCLKIIRGEVLKLPGSKSTTGWKKIKIDLSGDSPLSRTYSRNKYLMGNVYFNHAYGVFNQGQQYDYVLDHNLVGCQFHPEKSREFGPKILDSLINR
jgi:imidazole glycerol-phosphate synthase subunit HisH